MTALPIPGSPFPASEILPSTAPAPAGWLPAGRAAAILGVTPRAVQRWARAGELKAVLVREEGGAAAWYVDPSCKPALRIATGDLAPLAPAPRIEGELVAGLSDRKRQALYAKHRLVEEYLAALDARPADMQVVEFQTAWLRAWNTATPREATSERTLRRLLRLYKQGGLTALVDQRHNADAGATSPEALDFAAGLWLQQHRPSLAVVYQQTAAWGARLGWVLPSYGHFCRRLRKMVDPKVAALGRDPATYRNRMQLVLRRDWSKVKAMELWVADHRQLDIWVPRQDSDGRWTWNRPWLTAFIDTRSWYPVAWTLAWDSPDSDRVMATFARGVRAHGKPGWLYLDNGKDFRARKFAGGRPRGLVEGDAVAPMLSIMEVDVVWADPYNARAKVIENWFGRALSQHFDKNWATYCGPKPEERPERLKGASAAEAGQAGLTLDVVRQSLSDWIESDYAVMESPVSASRGYSTLRAFRHLRSPDFVRVTPGDEALAMLLLKSRPLTVRATGIEIREFNQTYWAAEIEHLRGASGNDESKKVHVRYDPGDPSRIWVFNKQDGFLCVATPYLGAGMHPLARAGTAEDQARLSDALAAQRRADKEVRERLAAYRQAAARHAPGLAREWAAHHALNLHEIAEPAPEPQAIIKLTPDLQRAVAAGHEHRLEEARKHEIAGLAVGELKLNRGGSRPPSEPSVLDLLPADPPWRAAQSEESEHDRDDGDQSA